MEDKNKAIELMNNWGSQGIPFIFITDFMGESIYLSPLNQVNPDYCRYYFPNSFNKNKHNKVLPDYPIIQKVHAIPYSDYLEQFKSVQKEINFGNSFLLNLTAETTIELSTSLSTIFDVAEAPYKILLKDKFVCFSPETFVKIQGNKISSFPMKGTIDGAIPDAAAIILNDPKETAEHYTIVDLIRNDLNLVAKKVSVERFRYLQKIQNTKGCLLQVSSIISGTLERNWPSQIGTIMFRMLPAGSISGAPKAKTVKIIKEVEGYNRGFYTGVAGIFDGVGLDSCVLIRFIEQRKGQYFYKSGGGITASSNPEMEYRELLQKIYIPQG